MAQDMAYQPLVLVETAQLTRPEWLEYRRKGLGGSDAAAVLNISPFRTARDLYYDKLGIVTVDDQANWVALALVVDIGGYTLDYIQIKKGRSDLVSCDSLENGVIMLYNKISSKVRAAQDILISEEEIDTILKGQPVQGLQEVVKVVEQCAQEFVSDLLSALRERQLELRTVPVIFVGGGSILLKRHIEQSGKVGHPMFVEDIRANVKGYETLYRLPHSGR